MGWAVSHFKVFHVNKISKFGLYRFVREVIKCFFKKVNHYIINLFYGSRCSSKEYYSQVSKDLCVVVDWVDFVWMGWPDLVSDTADKKRQFAIVLNTAELPPGKH